MLEEYLKNKSITFQDETLTILKRKKTTGYYLFNINKKQYISGLFKVKSENKFIFSFQKEGGKTFFLLEIAEDGTLSYKEKKKHYEVESDLLEEERQSAVR